MDNNKTQKIVGAGSVAGILLMIAILFSNGTFGNAASTISAAGLDSEGIVQMDESIEMEEGEGFGEGDEEMEDEDEMDEDEYDMDEDEGEEDENEGGILGFDFEFGWFGEKD